MKNTNRFLCKTLQRFTNAIVALTLSLALTAPTALHAAESVLYFHNDISGTPLAATDASGNVVWKETYRPYGERINNAPASGVGKGKNELYFHGKQQETLNNGISIQYFGARYYSPELAPRFLGVDPVHFVEGNVHSFNRFAYGNNNPYRYKDPDGNIPLDTILDVGSIIWDAGRGLGAAAAYAHGAMTGNQSLKAVAGEGLRETGVDLGISIGAVFTPYVSAGMVKAAAKAAEESTVVIGRVKDLQKLGANEKSLLDRLPNQGSPKANWKQNSGVLREEMGKGKPIRDASPGDSSGQFLNAERNLLQDRGWLFDGKTNLWNPPTP